MITATAEPAKVLGISPASLQDLFHEYKKAHDGSTDAPAGLIANTQTALRRYVTPALGGPSLEGLGRTEAAIAAQGFLETVPLARFVSVMDDLARYFEKASIPKKAQDSTRSYVRKLLDWAKSLGFLVTVSEQSNEASEFKPYRFHDPDRDRSVKGYRIPVTGKPCKARYSLGAVDGDYLNETLNDQIVRLEQYLAGRKLAPCTLELTLVELKRFLGWLVHYKGYSLAELTFESVIQFSPLYPPRDYSKPRVEWLEAKEDAKDMAEEVARKNINLIEEYLNFYSDQSRTKALALDSLVRVAQFLYKDETRDDEPFRDIPIIKHIWRKRAVEEKILRRQPNVVPIEKKTLDDWASVVLVLQGLKYEADLTHTDVRNSSCRTGYRKKKRPPNAIAKSYRRFLTLAFLVLLPPDRVQMLQSLELGVTLLRGSVKGRFPNERFTPADEKMADSPKAFWYIKLTNYKTAGKHGVFHMPVPDFWLGNKSFYQYIEEWLNVHRAVYKPEHNYFFLAKTGHAVSPRNIWAQFTKAFTRLAGKPVGPHMLRHIYRTDINRFEAKDDAFKEMVSETVGKMMRHKTKTANTDYNHPDLQARFWTIHAYNWHQYFEPLFGPDPRHKAE